MGGVAQTSLRYGPEGRLDASGTRDAFGALSDDLVREGYPPMTVNFGDRDMAGEVKVFTDRYRQQASGGGPFGDVRQWNGAPYGFPGLTRWVRVSPEGTVAPPGSSNHGKKRSADLGAPYNANTPAHRRAQKLAKNHQITCEGLGFTNVEWWHWTYWGPLGVIGQATVASVKDEEEEDNMQAFVKVTRDDKPLFAVVGRGGSVNGVPTSEAALRGVDKILAGFLSTSTTTPTVTISGEEWDAGALRAFGVED